MSLRVDFSGVFGTPFEVKNTVSKLSKIIIRSGNRVDALSCVYADGTSSGSYGGTGGQEFEFELEPDETITVWLRITVCFAVLTGSDGVCLDSQPGD